MLPQQFVKSILAKDANASIILAGDMNEFVQTRSVFQALNGVLTDINELSGVEPVERYTYVYDQHAQEIDQIFVSDAIGRRGTEVEHVHVNTWAASIGERASDHDPSVAKVRVCDTPGVRCKCYHYDCLLSLIVQLFSKRPRAPYAISNPRYPYTNVIVVPTQFPDHLETHYMLYAREYPPNIPLFCRCVLWAISRIIRLLRLSFPALLTA